MPIVILVEVTPGSLRAVCASSTARTQTDARSNVYQPGFGISGLAITWLLWSALV
jgi:hypothetical protein